VQLEIIDPLLQTMRDAKRLLASLPITLRIVADEVAVADLVALEALRTLAPELHSLLDRCSAGLTTTHEWPASREQPDLSQQVQQFVAADSRGGKIARKVIEVLFPAGGRHLGGATYTSASVGQWELDRRVAAASVLEFYLTQQLPVGVASAGEVTRVIASLGDVGEARIAFDQVDDGRLENLLERLQPLSETADPTLVAPAVEVLLEQFTRLRTGTRGFPDFGSEFAVTRPVLRLLRRVPQEEVFDLSARLVTSTRTLFAAFELVTIVGHRENAGHKLVSEGQALSLEQQLQERVINAPPSDLARECHIMRILLHVLQPAEGATEPVLPALSDPAVAAALFRDGLATGASQTIGSPLTRYSFDLHWDILVRLFGGEAALSEAAIAVESSLREVEEEPDEELTRALELTQQYLGGWRPQSFGRYYD